MQTKLMSFPTALVKQLLGAAFTVENKLYGTGNSDLPKLQNEINKLMVELNRRGELTFFQG